MDLKKQVNRGMIAIDAAINGMLKKNCREDSKKRILIVFQQIFGDAIIFSEALTHYAELYPAEAGYKITFIARPSVIAFLKATVPLCEKIDTQSVDFKEFIEDYQYYKKIVNKYRYFAEIIIVPGTSLSAEIFSCACNAKRKVGLMRSIPVTRPFVMSTFYRIAYTEMVVPMKEDMMLQRHRLLLNYLGLKDYKAVLPELLEKKCIIADEHYVVCCPGSSKPEKCWPINRFSTVIDHIIEKYGWKVHLCGGSDEIESEKFILWHVKNPEMVITHIGKTNYSDWSAIVQHADLVLGNDSATLHLAAAARVPAICITGIYDKYQFFPYKVDQMGENDRLPVALYKDMSCEWCRTIGYDAGCGNLVCRERLVTGKCALCIDAISVDEVIDKVNNMIKTH